MRSGPTRSSPEPGGLPPPWAAAGATASPSPHGQATGSTRESGLELGTVALPHPTKVAERIDTMILAGGSAPTQTAQDEHLLGWIRAAAPRCRPVATVCSGAFVGAAAGLLSGRRVTTHWARARQLGNEHPELTVDSDPIYVRDGKYWSSAGVTAGIDLSRRVGPGGPGGGCRADGGAAGSSCSSIVRAARRSSRHPSGYPAPSDRRSVPSRAWWKPLLGATTACPRWPLRPA